MLNIELSQDNIDFCEDFAKRIVEAKKGQKYRDDTNMTKHLGKEEWDRIYIGACGELAFSHYSGMAMNTIVDPNYNDGGVDFPDGSNIKATAWINKWNPAEYPTIYVRKDVWDSQWRVQRYVQAWVKLPIVQFTGWIPRDVADKIKVHCQECVLPSWKIPNSKYCREFPFKAQWKEVSYDQAA